MVKSCSSRWLIPAQARFVSWNRSSLRACSWKSISGSFVLLQLVTRVLRDDVSSYSKCLHLIAIFNNSEAVDDIILTTCYHCTFVTNIQADLCWSFTLIMLCSLGCFCFLSSEHSRFKDVWAGRQRVESFPFKINQYCSWLSFITFVVGMIKYGTLVLFLVQTKHTKIVLFLSVPFIWTCACVCACGFL